MIKNLRNVFEGINNIYTNINYKVDETRSEKDSIYFTTQIESQFFKGTALITGIVYERGVVNVIYTFGEIEANKKAYDVINEFNLFASHAKAYIGELNGKKLLEVRYSNAYEVADDGAVALFKFFFDDMLSEELVGHLTPMVALTK